MILETEISAEQSLKKPLLLIDFIQRLPVIQRIKHRARLIQTEQRRNLWQALIWSPISVQLNTWLIKSRY